MIHSLHGKEGRTSPEHYIPSFPPSLFPKRKRVAFLKTQHNNSYSVHCSHPSISPSHTLPSSYRCYFFSSTLSSTYRCSNHPFTHSTNIDPTCSLSRACCCFITMAEKLLRANTTVECKTNKE